MTKVYESDSLATAIETRTKQYKDLEDKLIALENTFKALVDNTEFKGKGADNIKNFYQAQIDLVTDWKKFIQAVTDFYSDVPKWAEDHNLAESTKVAVPFLKEGLETGSKNSKTMVETQHSDLEGILTSIHDLISLTAFSTEAYDTNMKKADTKRSETVTAVENLDTSYEETYNAQASTIGVVQQGYIAIMNATAKSGSVQPMNFNVKTYQADPIHEVRKNVQESIDAYEKQQEEAQKIRDQIAAEKARIEAEKARIEAEKNKPWYEKTWDGVKTFAGEFSGYYDSVRATTGVDPVTGRKLSNAERVAAGAMAAAGFIPVVGWAGRAVKGGSAIVKTAKGMNAANHMLDAYKSTKAMDILNKTEKGIYGLYTANSAWEYGSGMDMFGNKLTEEQRQNALWNGLTMGLVGGGAHIIDKGGLQKLGSKLPYSNTHAKDYTANAHKTLKEIGKQAGSKTHQLIKETPLAAKRVLQVAGRELAQVDIPLVVVREAVTTTGEKVRTLGMESRKLGDLTQNKRHIVGENGLPKSDIDPYGGYFERKDFRTKIYNAEYTPHGNKHIKAKTEEEAKRFSETGKKQAQYLPSVDNSIIEKEALLKGHVLDKGNNNYYFFHDAGKVIGYDNGLPTSWVRAELTSGGSYHGHPIAGDRLDKYLKKMGVK
ncbi:transposase [Bacillus sp. FJAT-42376]|uniref:T7SS effector LXG polymorphic toxin n=1 Tax=Bacillus sp. FJAT-42376 TaxID=2014076 RepID=UPI000F4F5748|nr:T7SS effector LXG polymorphic toxin [Bacillus sp. FJAT-42376]AZB41839.1 transposase [Bacillus sp. FJAT-42376]